METFYCKECGYTVDIYQEDEGYRIHPDHCPNCLSIKPLILGKMNRAEARGLAASAWCTKENENKVLDPELAEAFADILMRVVEDLSHPVLVRKNRGKI